MNGNPEHAKTIGLVAVVVAGGLASAAQFRTGHIPPVRIAIGMLALGVFLTGAAELAPELATAFSVLVLTSSVFVYGADGLGAIIALLNKASAPRKAPA